MRECSAPQSRHFPLRIADYCLAAMLVLGMLGAAAAQNQVQGALQGQNNGQPIHIEAMEAKFPNQLGGREPIVRRTVLDPEGIYYRALIGPFASLRAAAGVCNSLKAAGESCLVAKN